MERWSLMKGKYAMKEGRLDELREQLNQQKAVLETIEGRPRNQRQGIVNCREVIAVIEGKIKEIEELRVFYELDENNLFVVETTPGEVRYVATAANLNKTIPTYPKETPAMERTLAVFLEHERSPGVKVHVQLMMIRFDFFIDDGKHHNPNRGRVHVKYISGGPLLPRPGGGGNGNGVETFIGGESGRSRLYMFLLDCFLCGCRSILGARSAHLFASPPPNWYDWLLLFRGGRCGESGKRKKDLLLWYERWVKVSDVLRRFNHEVGSLFLRDANNVVDLGRRPCFGEDDPVTFHRALNTGEMLSQESYGWERLHMLDQSKQTFDVYFASDAAPPFDLLADNARDWMEEVKATLPSYHSHPALEDRDRLQRALRDGGYSFFTFQESILASQLLLELMIGVGTGAGGW